MKHRTFTQLLADVSNDFRMYHAEGAIDPSQLIKIAQKVNYELGLRVHITKDKVLDVTNGKTKLPEDFYVLNFATVCNKYTLKHRTDYGTVTEDIIVDSECCTKCGEDEDSCCCEKVYTVCDDVCVKVIHKVQFQTRVYEEFAKLYIRPSRHVDPTCMNTKFNCAYEAEIKNGYLYTNVDTCKVYISYEGALDAGDELMVPDHPVLNQYYESALKERILENLYFNGEDVERKWKMMQEERRKARKAAETVANTPDFEEMYRLWLTNRKAMYGKYYSMYKSEESSI